MLLHCKEPPLTHYYRFLLFFEGRRKAQTMEDALVKLQSGLDSALGVTLLFALTAVRSDLQRLPHPVSLSKRY